MTKRQLSSDEKKLCKRSIKQLQERSKLIRPKIKYYDYMLSEGLQNNAQEKYLEYLQIKKSINQELYTNDLSIIELQRQVQDGVEPKKQQKQNLCPQCGQEVKQNA